MVVFLLLAFVKCSSLFTVSLIFDYFPHSTFIINLDYLMVGIELKENNSVGSLMYILNILKHTLIHEAKCNKTFIC